MPLLLHPDPPFLSLSSIISPLYSLLPRPTFPTFISTLQSIMAAALSVGAPQPWPPPPTPSSDANKSFRDCQPGICTLTCRQYCSPFFFQPPPQQQQQQQLPFLNNPDPAADDDSSSSRSISPLMAALIAVLTAAFLLLFYYTVVSRLCRRGRRPNQRRLLRSLRSSDDPSIRVDPLVHDPARPDTGLDDTFIRQITVFKYNRGDGLVEATECAVCLSEFGDGESLRLMPNCEHAFHIPCIDTWLQSHSNCPLCRSTMNPLPVRSAETNNTNNSAASGGNGVTVAAMRVERGNDAVLVVREVASRGEVEVVVEAVEERAEDRDRKLDDGNGR